MKHIPICVCCITLLATAAFAAQTGTVEQAVADVHADIKADTDQLNALRDEIRAARIPLAEQLQTLRKEAAELRNEADRLRSLRRQDAEQQSALKNDVATLQDEYRFLFALFSEYRRSIGTRALPGDTQQLLELETSVDPRLREDTIETLPEGTKALLSFSENWNRRRLGGTVYQGSAMDPEGIEHTGSFLQMGPAGFFVTDDNTRGGITRTEAGMTAPGFLSMKSDLPRQIRRAVDGNEASLPVDVTGGDALRIQEARPSLMEHAKQGGLVMIPLVLVGAAALLLTILKIIQLARIRIHNTSELFAAVAQLKNKEADNVTPATLSLQEPLDGLLNVCIQHRKASRSHLEEIMYEHIMAFVPKLEKYLGTLAVLGGIAPLLGLLGTVTGMIHTFQLVTIFGTGNAKLLAGGISEALVTTEFGLAIAIPALLIHAYLARRARNMIGQLEQTTIRLVNIMAEEEGLKQ